MTRRSDAQEAQLLTPEAAAPVTERVPYVTQTRESRSDRALRGAHHRL